MPTSTASALVHRALRRPGLFLRLLVSLLLGLSLTAAAALLAACGGSGGDTVGGAAGGAAGNDAALLGAKIFADASLSASGKLACASCHSPDHAHAAPNDLAVQLGGADAATAGFRAAPSLRYLNLTPAFSFGKDGAPSGGFNRDGRAQSLAEQAARPFLAPHEMANANKADVVGRLGKAAYATQFRQLFGEAIFDNAEQAFDRATFALQAFQRQDPAFHPYDSKYDLFLNGKIKLEAAELRGLALFNDKNKGNCAACHPSARGADGAPPLFTDFSFDNLGVPRNPRIPATADPTYFDLGLCGPDRRDLRDRADLCGAFKVPTLRNVATRKAFFHNGAFTSLTEVLRFYVRRDTNPAQWYPLAADGTVMKFNDLPAQYRGNVNVGEAPYNRSPGMQPALDEAEIADLAAFLGTLTDGYPH